MRKVCTIAAAVLILGIGPLLAAEPTAVSIPRPTPSGPKPATVSEGFLASALIVAKTDPEGVVPCFNCVSGPDIETLLVGVPLADVYSGQSITIMLLGDDMYYSGEGVFTYAIKANPTVAPVMTGSYEGSFYPSIWFVQFPITAPAPGQYILEGVISVGQNFHDTTTVSTNLIIGPTQD